MEKNEINTMFLIPEKIYKSIISRIEDDETREELNLLNRQRDDGNYIDKQQEMQMNTINSEPVVTETIDTDTNNNIDQNVDSSVLQTEPNIEPVSQTEPNIEPTATDKVDLSPIENTLLEPDAEGKFTCRYCKEKFDMQSGLRVHLLCEHKKDISLNERQTVLDIPRLDKTQSNNFENGQKVASDIYVKDEFAPDDVYVPNVPDSQQNLSTLTRKNVKRKRNYDNNDEEEEGLKKRYRTDFVQDEFAPDDVTSRANEEERLNSNTNSILRTGKKERLRSDTNLVSRATTSDLRSNKKRKRDNNVTFEEEETLKKRSKPNVEKERLRVNTNPSLRTTNTNLTSRSKRKRDNEANDEENGLTRKRYKTYSGRTATAFNLN